MYGRTVGTVTAFERPDLSGNQGGTAGKASRPFEDGIFVVYGPVPRKLRRKA